MMRTSDSWRGRFTCITYPLTAGTAKACLSCVRSLDSDIRINIVAGAYFGLGDFAEGAQIATESVRMARATHDANLVNSLFTLGLAKRCLRDPSAVRTLEEALALSPHDPRIMAALGDNISGLCRTQGNR